MSGKWVKDEAQTKDHWWEGDWIDEYGNRIYHCFAKWDGCMEINGGNGDKISRYGSFHVCDTLELIRALKELRKTMREHLANPTGDTSYAFLDEWYKEDV